MHKMHFRIEVEHYADILGRYVHLSAPIYIEDIVMGEPLPPFLTIEDIRNEMLYFHMKSINQ